MKISMNKDQLKAVQHDNGPLLVIAGAGTGKTRVITERIKRLIQEKVAEPEEILALTFTEKAAREMLDRIGDIMPLGYVEPWVSTFHSFSDRILRKEGLEIGLDPSYKIITYPDQWMLVRKHLFKMDLNYFRPLGNPTKFISAILKFTSRIQDENVTKEDFGKFVEGFEGTPEEKDRWKELHYIFETYENLKIQESKMDFGDLINWTIKLFKSRENILEKYKKQFKHVLVDEFQDTNYAQYELIKLLFSPQEKTKKRSLLAVGDDSQSIYKFRGAAVSNILQFRDDYKDAQTLTLTSNYRSTQKILNPAYKLIKNNDPDTLENKLGISKELTSMVSKEGPTPLVLQSQTLEEEVSQVVKKIFEIMGAEPEYSYKDFAILARANNHLDPIVMALRKNKIPYQLVGNRGLYDTEEIRDIMALLRVVVNPNNNIALYRALSIETLNIPPKVLSQILFQSQYKKTPLWETLQKSNHDEIKNFLEILEKAQEKLTKINPSQFVYELVQEAKYISKYLRDETVENQMSIKNMDLFLTRIKKFEVDYRNENKDIPTIVDFLNYLDLVLEAGENPAQAEIEDIDTVNLMTVHAAKGLEFPVVFIINMIAGRFPTRNRGDPIEIPDELVKEILPEGDPHIQEERRLFYVGITRAKKYLFVTLAKNYGGKREARPSGYIKETGVKIQEVKDEDENIQTALFGIESGFKNTQKNKIKFTPKSLSYSQINTYENCPLQYKYRYVLKVPTQPSHALSFGITIHDTLRDFHRKQLFQEVSCENLYKMYEANWQPLGYMDEEHRKLRFEDGKKLLKKYYTDNKAKKVKHLYLEKSFTLNIDGLKFYGRIDRVDKLENGGVEIIDYKTGKTKSQKEVDKDAQVGFYAIGAQEALNLQPEKLTYYFLESGEKVSTTRNQKQLNAQKQKAIETVEKMRQGDFEAKPSMLCKWCDYEDICPKAWKK
jgi:DNA helicase-2/ATP-dependent DNA helicase PcrA